MTRRRIIAAFSAALLTVIAAVILVAYVGGADQRAAAALEPQSVLVVVEPVAKGTAAESLGASVEVRQVPRSALAEGAAPDVSAISGKVASIDLVPGEQVLASRFVDPADLQSVQVPAGMQEISVMLSSERVYGGRPAAGDTVGVFVTQNETTKVVLNRVLVTRAEGGAAAQAAAADAAAEGSQAPQSEILLTLALDTDDAEKVVWAKENGTIWLSLQNQQTNTGGSRAVTAENVNQ